MDIPRERRKARRAVAGVIASVIMFTLLFTVGLGFFLNVDAVNQQLQSAQNARDQALRGSLSENLQIITGTVPSGLPGAGDLNFTVTDLGGTTVTIVSMFITQSSTQGGNTVLVNSASYLPLALTPALKASSLDTSVQCSIVKSSDICVLKLVTSRGNVFLQVFPNNPSPSALTALQSGAIGILFLSSQQSFKYYNVVSSGCPFVTDTSGVCLSSTSGADAFNIPSSQSPNPTAFSIRVTNYDPNMRDVILDEHTFLMGFIYHASGLQPNSWYIVSNTSTTILQHYYPVVLKYNVPVTLVFAHGPDNPGNQHATCQPSEAVGTGGCQLVTSINDITTPSQNGKITISVGDETAFFIDENGCVATGITSCQLNSANYGQNMPYVTSLWYP